MRMALTQVGVLRGGPSAEYEVSLESGRAVMEALDRSRYEPREIFIDKQGGWYMRGLPVQPARALGTVDVVVNALHGAYGEDGTVQKVLSSHGVPYTGSDALASAIGMNKVLTKEHVAPCGARLAEHRVLGPDEADDRALLELFRTMLMPVVVKPKASGSSVHVYIVRTYPALVEAVRTLLAHYDDVLIERHVRGTEATVAVIEGFRGEPLYACPPVEIVPTKSEFFNYEEKYDGHAREICPGRFSREISEELLRLAKEAHRALGLRHYSRSDFIVAKDGIYFLEVNTLPGLTPASLLPKAVSAVGSSLSEFVSHITELALSRK